MTRQDILACLVIGLSSAGLLQFLVRMWELPDILVRSAPLALAVVPGASLAVVAVGIRLSPLWPPLASASKFVLVGVLNTLIDLAVLNLLLKAAGVTRGFLFVLFKIFSFAVAVVNGFFWNRSWAFASSAQKGGSQHTLVPQFALFTTVTVVGIGLNAAVAAWLVHRIQPGPLFSPLQWANIAAGVALVVSTVWNYCAYRFLVFKPRSE